MRTKKITRIDSLTDEQKARFGEWRDKWIAIGLSTAPADRPKFEAAVAECYRFAKLAPPKVVVWVQSPLVMAWAGPIAGRLLLRGSAVRSAVDDAVRGAVDGAVGGAVRSAVGGAVRSAVGDAVDGAVDDAVRSAVHGAVRGAVHGAVGDAVDGARNNWHRYMGGQFWAGGWWGSPAYTSFFRDVCNLSLDPDIAARAAAYQATCESACWWWPHRDFVIACERPRTISRDDRGRLHSETGNAIEFRDGWGVAAWHGTVVPVEWLRDRAKLDPRLALTHPNVEQRRAAAEIMGWAKVLASVSHRVIDTDPDPEIGKLVSVDLPDAPDSRFVLVRCATGRDFALPVPREMATALAANAWTYGIEPVELRQLEVRT